MSNAATVLVITCVQAEPRIGAVRDNIAKSVALVKQTAERGAELMMLPELCNSGYVFESREEAASVSEGLRSGPAVGAWTDLAARRRLSLVASLNEHDVGWTYNSAVVIGLSRVLGVGGFGPSPRRPSCRNRAARW